MKILERLKEWWGRLKTEEQRDIKMSAIFSVIGVALCLASIPLIPFFYPMLAGAAIAIGIASAVAFVLCVFLKFVAPIISDHWDDLKPRVHSVSHAAPSTGFAPDAKLEKAQEKDFSSDRNLLPTHERAHDETETNSLR